MTLNIPFHDGTGPLEAALLEADPTYHKAFQ